MSTPNTVISQLQKLVTDANGVTGKSDTTITDAISHLISGYGSGGDEGTPTCYCEIVTVSTPVMAGNITLVSGNSWIAQNYSNSAFTCGFVNISTTSDTTSQHVSSAIASNSYVLADRYFLAGGGNAGGLKTWSATGTAYKALSNYTGTGYGHVHADSSGNIVAHAPSSYTLRSGVYMVWYGLVK